MKRNNSGSDNYKFSLARERINTIIERDVLLSAVLVLVFSLLHVTGSIIADTGIAIGVVFACEIINAAVRKNSEPTAFSNTGSGAEVYANTYDDSVEFEDIPDPQPVRRNKILDELNAKKAAHPGSQQKTFSADELKGMISKASSSLQKKGASSGNTGKFLTYIIIILCVISIGFPMLILSDSDDGTNYENSEYEYAEDDMLSSPFYTEEDYLSERCDRCMEILMNSDYDGIMSVADGQGDVKALLDMTDWSSASWTEENRALHDEDNLDYAFVRYFVETDNGEYMVAFRFEGNDLAFNESDAVLTGIAACPNAVFEEYTNVDDFDWDAFHEEIESQMEYAGDVTFEDYNILSW